MTWTTFFQIAGLMVIGVVLVSTAVDSAIKELKK